jgi:hypothetical protein
MEFRKSWPRQQALAVRQFIASSFIPSDHSSASEYHGLPAKKIQLPQSFSLISNALPVTPYSSMVEIVMLEGRLSLPGTQ